MWTITNDDLYLAHHGIKGQKWGIRRYQNEDGSYTSEGRRRYGFGERMANTGRKIRDYMTVKGDDGKRHLSEKGKKVVKGAAIGTASVAAIAGIAIAGSQFLKNRKAIISEQKAIDGLGKEIADGKELVNHFFNKKTEAENTIHDLKQQSAKYDKIYGEYKRHQKIADSIPTEGAGWWTEYSSYARNNPNKRNYAFAKSREYGIESAKANRAMNKWYREYSEPLKRAELNKSMYSWNLDDASKTLQNNRMEVIKRQEAINYFKKHPLRSKMK